MVDAQAFLDVFSEIVRHGGGILAHVDEEVGAAQVSELGLGPEHGEGALAAFGKDGEVAGPSRGRLRADARA